MFENNDIYKVFLLLMVTRIGLRRITITCNKTGMPTDKTYVTFYGHTICECTSQVITN